jgi:predicted nucleic acid-binding protein
MSAFVDSSVWFAAAATRDAQNERAKSILQSIDQYLTTDLVLVETCQLLKARFGRGVAEVFWERLRDSGVQIEPIVRADLDAASEIGARFPDESFSFVDRTSFALMERMGSREQRPSTRASQPTDPAAVRSGPSRSLAKATAKSSSRSDKRFLNAGLFK